MANNPPRQRVGFSNHLRWLVIDAFASSAYADNIIGIARIIVAAPAFVIFKEGEIRLPCVGLIGGAHTQIVIIFQAQIEIAAKEKIVGVVGLIAEWHFDDACAADNSGGKLIAYPGVMNNIHIIVV